MGRTALRNTMVPAPALAAAALLLAACPGLDGLEVRDQFTFAPTRSTLNTPYVEGAKVEVQIRRLGGGTVTGWSATTDDSAVFSVHDSMPLGADDYRKTFKCTAASEGQTELRILDSEGNVQAVRPIRVERPDAVRLIHDGLQLVRNDEVKGRPLDRHIKIVKNAEVVFEVAYYKGRERLKGNGLLVATADYGIRTEELTVHRNKVREFLRITAGDEGTYPITLWNGNRALGTLTVETVTEQDVHSVRIEKQPADSAADGDWLHLLARAFDADGVEIYGVGFQWTDRGIEEPDTGPLFRYEYKPGAHGTVTASAGGSHESVTVEMRYGAVGEHMGCAVVGPSDSIAVLFALLALMGLALRARRK